MSFYSITSPGQSSNLIWMANFIAAFYNKSQAINTLHLYTDSGLSHEIPWYTSSSNIVSPVLETITEFNQVNNFIVSGGGGHNLLFDFLSAKLDGREHSNRADTGSTFKTLIMLWLAILVGADNFDQIVLGD